VAHVISFSTGKFDISKETPNDINPIAGESVLNWVSEKLAGTPFSGGDPSTEDWGWYIHVEGAGATYMVGASGEPVRPPPDMDWVIQVHKLRSFKDKLMGRNKQSDDDPLFVLLEKLVRGEPEFRDVSIHGDP